MGVKGRRGGSTPKVTGFREKARQWVLDHLAEAEALAARKLAQGDPSMFQWLAEHGFGRAPQSLDVHATGNLEFRACFDDGTPVSPETAAVPEGAGR